MKTLEKGSNKIKHICEILRKDTLEPAEQEAEGIIVDAQSLADKIVKKAHADANEILSEARQAIEQERRVLESSLVQACKQSIEKLKQDIEHKIFDEELCGLVAGATKDASVIATLINTVVATLEKEGLEGDISAIIPAKVSAEDVNALLFEGVIEKLKEGDVLVGNFAGGVRVRLHEKRLVLDLSDEALREILGSFLRKDFCEALFKT
ncbi:MAG: V-type ATP synthase subunit E [Waddliaceae bacterium]|jgi:V/A-type H+/Na+-transporting ATPase subunit E|nr:V-type ATP synthase subunit E [Waddliaceae bacterium]MBT3579072.1 V-type ATP synthase subunit E [Waddliaceae bacterium]MBT4444782.1 V-type ATP synthase subunit E [Waddliaceae bacterium]MBT6928051.1 V-type ATP synthase subunit E [Waddliaceae bacterium]MBT7264435.1 V-type ATP synthase subunit E [Waddliaceae bacterium]